MRTSRADDHPGEDIMVPIEPAAGSGDGVMPMQPLPAQSPAPADIVPAQAMAHGGTFVRPGALAWRGTREAPDGAYSSCEIVEQVPAAAVNDPGRLDDFLDELARARLWVPRPAVICRTKCRELYEAG